MRLQRKSFRGLTCFRGAQPVTIDFGALGPGLIALVGRTGAGKTTVMESTPACLYQRFPTRPGSLYEWVHGADAFIEDTYTDGDDEYVTRLMIDASKKATEGYFFRNGQALSSGKLAEYNAQVERYFGSLDLFLAAPFAAQSKAGNFLFMPKLKRKELFIELLTMSQLEIIAIHAGRRRVEAERQASLLSARIGENERALEAVAELEQSLRDTESMAAVIQSRLEAALDDERKAQASADTARDAQGELTRLVDREAALKALVESSTTAFRAAGKAETEAKTLYQSQITQVRSALSDLDESALALRQQLRRESLARRATEASEVLKEEPAIKAAGERLAVADLALTALRGAKEERSSLESQLRDARHAHETAQRALTTARNNRTSRLADLDRRSTLLASVPCTSVSKWFTEADIKALVYEEGKQVGSDLRGTCPLLTDAQAAAIAATELRGTEHFADLESALVLTERAVDSLQAAITDTTPVTEKQIQQQERVVTEMRQTTGRASLIIKARSDLQSIAEEQTLFEANCARETEDLRTQKERATARLSSLENELARTLQDHAGTIHRLQADVERVKRDFGEASTALQQARQNLPDHRSALAALENAVTARQRVEKSQREQEQAAAGFKARLDQLGVNKDALVTLRGERAAYLDAAANATLVEQGFGKDGIQALEIDAAGPGVAELTNKLLDACFGPQFSISFETLRAKKSKKGEFTEAFDVRVFLSGTELPVEGLSGGQKVIVGEAIGLAIAIFNARRSGIHWETLFRDETAGALDQIPNEDGVTTSDAYVTMLRQALVLGLFYQVIFAAHQPAVYQAADVQLLVADGTISVGVAPMAEAA